MDGQRDPKNAVKHGEDQQILPVTRERHGVNLIVRQQMGSKIYRYTPGFQDELSSSLMPGFSKLMRRLL